MIYGEVLIDFILTTWTARPQSQLKTIYQKNREEEHFIHIKIV